jgi:hypothetical protein
MTIFVSITDACAAEARQSGQSAAVQKLAAEVERIQNIDHFDRHLPFPIVKKVLGKTFRLYAIEQLQDETGHRVIRFARFLVKGQNEDFHRQLNEERFRESFIQEGALSASEVAAVIEQRIAAGVVGPAPVTEDEARYLDVVSTTLYQNEPSVYETSDWVDLLKAPWMNEFRRGVAGILQELVVQGTKEERSAATRYPADRNQRGILYRQFSNGLLLVAPVGYEKGLQEDHLRQRYREVFEANEGLAEEELRKFSLRTYPEFVVSDEGLWVTLETAGKDANLSLSPEELGLLHTLLTPGEVRNPYPLFINGRPGSGKTTILHYLFAEHLHHHLTAAVPLPNPPLYLTYSSLLTGRAKDTVSTILACDYRRIENPPDMDSPLAQEIIGRAFQVFRDMLLSLLTSEIRTRFKSELYVDFPRFRTLWKKSFAQGGGCPSDLRNAPELAWHAIRTFIKGRCPADGEEDDFGPDRYAELPKRQKSIDEGVFQKIHQVVWREWYKPYCDKYGLWDDQDLTMAVLRQESLSRFPAIVCDEAQDFTANELTVILRLSVFSTRAVPHYLLGKIPFAFAGDPFQTLNPTGFNWESLSDSFRENLLRELDPDGRHALTVNFRELELNYRSAEPIVRLCNLIQLLRGILFEVGGLRPQQTWRNDAAPDVALFCIEDATTRDQLRRQAAELVFIVPSQDESEDDYIRSDKALSGIANGGAQAMPDIFNPMRAKGMEFGRVVIYKFGDWCLNHLQGLPDLLARPNTVRNTQEGLSYEYFLNRLYVGLSRARSRLLIVDTQDGIDKFWGFARGYQHEDLIAQYKSRDAAWLPKDLGIAIQGEAGAWADDEADDNADIGQQYLDRGEQAQDPYLLDRAAARFDRVPDESNALRSRALACYFRENYVQAGRLFARIPDVDMALKSFWLAGDHSAFLNMARNRGHAGDPRFHAARYMESKQQEDDARTCFKSLYDILANRGTKTPPTDNRLRSILDQVLTKLLARLDAHPKDARALADARDDGDYLERVQDVLEWTPAASTGYAVVLALAGKDAKAAAAWKTARCGEAEAPDVVMNALAQELPFPENLPFVLRLGDAARLAAAAKSGDWSRVSLKTVSDIAVGLWRSSREDEFETVALAQQGARAFAVFEGLTADDRSQPKARRLATRLVTCLAERGDLRGYLGILVAHQLPDVSKVTTAWVESAVQEAADVHRDGIRALAASGIDPDSLDAGLRDWIEQYFDGLIRSKHKVLSNVTPFEVGVVLELSGKYKLMQQYYELVFKARDPTTDPEIVHFAKERIVFARVGLVSVMTKDVKLRARLEKEYKESARQWSISLPNLPSRINLHPYRALIDRFYLKQEQSAAVPEESIEPSPMEPNEAPASPDGVPGLSSTGTPPLPPGTQKPLAAALGNVGGISGPGTRPGFAATTQPNPASAVKLDADTQHSHEEDTVIVSTGGLGLEITCNYFVPRIEVRNTKTRETAVVRPKNGVLTVSSGDFDVEGSNGAYILGDWGVSVAIRVSGDRHSQVELRVRDDGPVVQLMVRIHT